MNVVVVGVVMCGCVGGRLCVGFVVLFWNRCVVLFLFRRDPLTPPPTLPLYSPEQEKAALMESMQAAQQLAVDHAVDHLGTLHQDAVDHLEGRHRLGTTTQPLFLGCFLGFLSVVSVY